jgi:hypothetical protein
LDPARQTFFMWLGVVPYLTEEAALSTLRSQLTALGFSEADALGPAQIISRYFPNRAGEGRENGGLSCMQPNSEDYAVLKHAAKHKDRSACRAFAGGLLPILSPHRLHAQVLWHIARYYNADDESTSRSSPYGFGYSRSISRGGGTQCLRGK